MKNTGKTKENTSGLSGELPGTFLSSKMDLEEILLSASSKRKLNSLVKGFLKKQSRNLFIGRTNNLINAVLFYGINSLEIKNAAANMGRQSDRMVFRVELPRVLGKYIGETEKNLQSLFATAEEKNWILFFDEADALFGKRTDIKDSHDKYSNQEVDYLLQRIEEFSGLVILASNARNNMDDAFLRRLRACIYFKKPADQV